MCTIFSRSVETKMPTPRARPAGFMIHMLRVPLIWNCGQASRQASRVFRTSEKRASPVRFTSSSSSRSSLPLVAGSGNLVSTLVESVSSSGTALSSSSVDLDTSGGKVGFDCRRTLFDSFCCSACFRSFSCCFLAAFSCTRLAILCKSETCFEKACFSCCLFNSWSRRFCFCRSNSLRSFFGCSMSTSLSTAHSFSDIEKPSIVASLSSSSRSKSISAR
mmetsp:Transcript_52513/g.94182  ORF Transcript_52513/g.94182 Transcript_52513/m.94182 type:complete len:219 (-) Transcript_52513:590-1246(-)